MFGFAKLIPVFSLRSEISNNLWESQKNGVFFVVVAFWDLYITCGKNHTQARNFVDLEFVFFLVLNSMSSTGIALGF